MKRSVELLGGGVLGFVLGTVFLANPIAAAMSHLRPGPPGAWPDARRASTRSPSTAQLRGGGPVYNATTSVQVPHSDVVQVFNDVPPGQYTVSASLRRGDGGVVGSGVQTVATEDGVATATLLRGRDSVTASHGNRGRSKVSDSACDSGRQSARARGHSRCVEASRPDCRAARRHREPPRSREWLVAELIRLSDPDGLESGWHQVQLLDLDGDGLVDEIRIEPPNGTAVVWRLVPQGLPVR